jgi:DnaK suppressor protein
MEQKDLDYFKNLLTNWLAELLSQADNTVLGLRDSEDNLSDPLDRAAYDTERSYLLRMRDRESVLIKKIKRSLEDIEDGIYGICEDCGTDISIKRLKARPVARRCIECKTRQENIEKLIGA